MKHMYTRVNTQCTHVCSFAHIFTQWGRRGGDRGGEEFAYTVIFDVCVCVFTSSDAWPWRTNLPWGHIGYHTQPLLAQVYKPADALVPFDSPPSNPAVRDEIRCCDQSAGERGHVECDGRRGRAGLRVSEKWSGAVICSLLNSRGGNYILLQWRFFERWSER